MEKKILTTAECIILILYIMCTGCSNSGEISESTGIRLHSSIKEESATTESNIEKSDTHPATAETFVNSVTSEISDNAADEYYYRGTIFDCNMNTIIFTETDKYSAPYRKMNEKYTGLSNIICDQSLGLDLSFEKILRSRNPSKVNIDDSIGRSVQLTINADMSQKIYNRMEKENITGSVVILRDDGSIASIVSSPSYDANKLYSDSDYEKTLSKSGVFINRALQKAAPGSTFKIMSEVLLNKYKIDEEMDEGKITVDGTVLQNWDWGQNDNYPFQTNRQDAFIRSSNVYFAKGFKKIGYKNVRDSLAEYFMYGDDIKIDCDFTTLSNSLLIDTNDDLYRSAFGQAKVRTTPLYLAAVTHEAIYGSLLKPYILNSIVDTKTNGIIENTNHKKELSNIPKEYYVNLRKYMLNVGKSLEVDIPEDYTFYAKTGTADISDNEIYLYVTGVIVNTTNNRGYTLTVQIQNPKKLNLQYASGSAYIYNDILKILLEEELS